MLPRPRVLGHDKSAVHVRDGLKVKGRALGKGFRRHLTRVDAKSLDRILVAKRLAEGRVLIAKELFHSVFKSLGQIHTRRPFRFVN